MRADGVLTGKITRPKTSGVGKKVGVMNFYIAKDAYIHVYPPPGLVVDRVDIEHLDVDSE